MTPCYMACLLKASWTGITENAKRQMCFDVSVGWRTLHQKMEHRMHERGKK